MTSLPESRGPSLMGLAGDRVFVITEDRQAQIWVGTDEGLSRIDGEAA